jgi:hypothetical protein
MVMHRELLPGLLSLSALCVLAPLAASAAGQLVQSWRTDGGWLTELRVHPNGAKVCSTGKAAQTPHTFGLSFVRSGAENVVRLVDERDAPAGGSGGDMTFEQSGKMVAILKVRVAGPAWASTEPTGPQAKALMANLSAGPLTISVAGRQYQMDLTGIGDAMAQLRTCEAQAG